MKKLLSYILCVALTYGGLWLAILAEFNDTKPLAQGGQAIIAAIIFCFAILCAGYGNSLTWKGEKKHRG